MHAGPEVVVVLGATVEEGISEGVIETAEVDMIGEFTGEIVLLSIVATDGDVGTNADVDVSKDAEGKTATVGEEIADTDVKAVIEIGVDMAFGDDFIRLASMAHSGLLLGHAGYVGSFPGDLS